MKIKLHLFSVSKDIAGFNERVIELPDGSSASAVIDYLVQLDSRFDEWKNLVRIAVNQQYVSNDYKLQDKDEVAVIPPVSGG